MSELIGDIGGILSTCLAAGGFVFSELLLILSIFRKVLKAELRDTFPVAVIVIFLQLLLTHSPSEAFCSGFPEGYVFSYNEAVLLTALLILLYHTELRGVRAGVLAAQLLILSALTAGGAYAVAVFMAFAYLTALIWYWRRRARERFAVMAGFLLYIVVLGWHLPTILEDADFVAAQVAGASAVKVVWRSLKTAVPYAVQCMSPACMIGAAILVPLFIKAVRGKRERYPLPVLVSAVSFGLFVTLFFPGLYTSGLVGGNQVLNIYRWSFYLWLYGNELYWTGWYIRRYREEGA